MEKFLALAEEKQTTIRNAALACFAKYGYEKTSIHDIASAAGVSKASIFQYFGNKQALYEYLCRYCVSQMKQAYDLDILDEHADFFDRVWAASVMKVENLKKHPYVAAFITGAVTGQTPEQRDAMASRMEEWKPFVEMMVLHEEDSVKFKRPGDAQMLFQTLMLLAQGMAFQLENRADYDAVMNELEAILKMLKCNFYKEEYLS